MVCIVQIGNSNPQWFNTSSWPILTTGHRDLDGLRTVKASFDIIVDLWGALTEIGPAARGIGEAMFVRSFGTPDYTRAGS